MIWSWSLPWVANLVLLVLVGIAGLRVTLEIIAIFLPQYRPIGHAVDQIAKKLVLFCLRVLLSAIIVSLSAVIYALLVLDLVARGLLRVARFVGARVDMTLPLPIPESPRLPRIRFLLSVQPPDPKPADSPNATQPDGSLTSLRR